MVSKILSLDVVVETKDKNFAMSVDSEQVLAKNKLLASANFVRGFEAWIAELKAEEGSTRARKKPGEPYDLNTFPKRVHPKMANYDIADCPWKTHGQAYDRQLLGSVLYAGKEAPQIKIKEARIRDWETSLREMLSMLSYMDMFTAASIELVKGMAGRLEEDTATSGVEVVKLLDKLGELGVPRETLEEVEKLGQGVYNLKENVWNDAQDTIGLLHSVGKGVQDNVNNVIDVIGSAIVTRRDTWLDKFKGTLKKESLIRLRTADLNAEQLFGREALEEAFEEARSEKKDKVQETFLASHSKTAARGYSGKSQGGGNGGKANSSFNRRGFQQRQKQPQQQTVDSGAGSQPFHGRGRRIKGSGCNRGNNRGGQ